MGGGGKRNPGRRDQLRVWFAICRAMRWTLDEVRRLDVHETVELVEWLKDEADRASHANDDSVDMDALLAARRGTPEE